MLDRQLQERLKAAIHDATRESAKVIYTNAFAAPDQARVDDVIPGQTLWDLAPKDSQLPVVCLLNDEYVLRCDWEVMPTPGDLVMFVTHPLGGGGSNPLRIILQIALLIAVAVFQPQLLALVGPQLVGVASAGILIAGNLLINVLVPVKPAVANAGQTAEASPTYSTNASGNQARLDAAIPTTYGRFLVFPDFACQPYTEYIDNEQYFYGIFTLGQGSYDIESIMIDDTQLSHFVDVAGYPVGVGGLPLEFPINAAVVNAPEVTGQELLATTVIGPFTACGPGFKAQYIAIDVIMPRGLYYAKDDGSLDPKTVTWLAEARVVNDLGTPTSPWQLLGSESVTAATTTEIRKSYKYTVTPARYEVRMSRQDVYDDRSRAAHTATWTGMRTYLKTPVAITLEPSASYYGIKMKASAQLNGLTQRKFGFILKRKLRVWTVDDGWDGAPVYTRNPAWAAADILRDKVYGGNIPDSRIDVPTLVELAATWDERGDHFDGSFDTTGTLWDALAAVMRAGRAVRYMRNGVFTFVRDEKQIVPRALFTGRNILKGTFSIDYITPTDTSPDGVTIQYWDNILWDWKYLTIPSPGVDVPENPQQITLFGVTDENQASREGLYTVAADRFRRRIINISTEMDGFIPTYGDLIAVAYDLPSWGSTTGDVDYYDPVTKIVTLSEAVSLAGGATHYIAFASPTGEVLGPYEVGGGSDAYSVVLTDATGGEELYFGNEMERTRFTIGPADNIYRLARVLSVTPKDAYSVDINAVIEDDRVHTYDGGSTGGGVIGTRGRIARYSPDGIPVYDSASTTFRNKYGFYAKDTGKVGTANDPGYKYDDS